KVARDEIAILIPKNRVSKALEKRNRRRHSSSEIMLMLLKNHNWLVVPNCFRRTQQYIFFKTFHVQLDEAWSVDIQVVKPRNPNLSDSGCLTMIAIEQRRLPNIPIELREIKNPTSISEPKANRFYVRFRSRVYYQQFIC